MFIKMHPLIQGIICWDKEVWLQRLTLRFHANFLINGTWSMWRDWLNYHNTMCELNICKTDGTEAIYVFSKVSWL